MGEKSGAKADQHRAQREQRLRVHRRREDDKGKGEDTDQCTEARHPVRVSAIDQPPRRHHEANNSAGCQQRREQSGGCDRKAEQLRTIGLQQNILHGEGGGAQAHADQAAHPGALPAHAIPGFRKALGHRLDLVGSATDFLPPQRGRGQEETDHRATLDHLDQLYLGEIGQDRTEDQRPAQQSQQQQDREECHDLRLLLGRRQIRGQRKARGLYRVDANAHHQEGHRGAGRPGP